MPQWSRMLLSLLICALTACNQSATPAAPVRAPLQIKGITTFTISQRTTTALPGSADALLLTIDDITGGQTMTSLEWRDGEHVLGPRALRLNDTVDFIVGGQNWRLTLSQMHNELIGNDWVEFTLRERAQPGAADDAAAEIDALLIAVAELEGAEFIRNGQSHAPATASQHLREKWRANEDSIISAEDFIVTVGSHSSASGEAYTIRLADGSTLTAERWLSDRLQIIRALR